VTGDVQAPGAAARDGEPQRARPGDGAVGSGRADPVLVFDGDCAFCTACARAIERIAPGVDVVAWQLADLEALGITAEQAAEAVRLVEADGAVRTGHEAIAGALEAAGGAWSALGRVLVQPGVSRLAAKAYAAIAANRGRLPGATPACARPRDRPQR
jgi:predicted DCC family thiol-disulfide oxidoreductase YuxK